MEQVIGYCRVSTGNQGDSLEVQSKKIREYCLFKGLNLIDILQDEDVSGGKEFSTRVGGAKVFDYIDKGIKTVVSIKLDRLFRNTSDALLTINEWNEKNVDLQIIDMGGNSFTTKTAIGKLIFTIVVSHAEFEKNITGERTKSVLNHRKEEGKSYCGAIFGFDNVGGKMVKNEVELAIVRQIKNFRTGGMSSEAIAKDLNEKGYVAKKGGPFHASTIQNILKNPIYNEA